jgi:hypothetical protein
MKLVSTLCLVLLSFALLAQDLTGTWEGELVKDGNVFGGIQRNYKMKWELVQIGKEVFGIVYFYPQDTKPGDKPNAWYTWYGKQGKKNIFPFQFIKGRYVDGLGASGVYQFNVKYELQDSAELLTGVYHYQLEAINSRERPAGFYRLKKISDKVSDELWLKRKEKEIIEKLEKQNQTFSRR